MPKARLLLIWSPADESGAEPRALASALEGGVAIVQIRAKLFNSKELYGITMAVAEVIRDAGALLFVNDRADVALACGADGVHLGQEDLRLVDARKFTPAGFRIGVSTHTLEQVDEARTAGADLLGFGPMFPTATKPKEPVIGPADLAEADRRAGVPLFAIGGLTADRILQIGARRAAVSSAILKSNNPRTAASSILAALERNGPVDKALK